MIQEHHARRLHFDLRLERDGVLRSWAVPKGVPESPGTNHLAVQTEDHPMEYLGFAGTIPEGQYGAGSMTVWDTGTYETEKWRADEVIVTLHGRVGGPLGRVRVALIRTQGEGEKSQWLLHRMKSQRPAVDPDAMADAAPRPVAQAPSRTATRTGTDAARQPSAFPKPMLAAAGTPGLVAGDEWAIEWKWDGVRVIARVEDGAVRLVTRTGLDRSKTYPELAALAAAVRADAVLDGEVVALDEHGRPDFGLLQQRMNLERPREIAAAAASVPVGLRLFDVLEIAGVPTIGEPYDQRRERLERMLRPGVDAPVEVSPRVDLGADAALERARADGLEGIVAKRRSSPYRPGSAATTGSRSRSRAPRRW
ncbi:hypothetical protein GCM10025870_15120 [Agromyces marinus]|uniref:ATP-dependent DNA ligase family profile domain-containing protein n=1 Tax=Agromyces marinus TaxID=1389020 RepID=A0ABM8H112_9MICO|nr:hypothetical protein GCM10025870_15120 [Agromyces marinus]